MPEISVVLPVYNGETYLRQAIESIINQTIQDWELIIVNDCSTDASGMIAEEYASRDRRIRIINNSENQKLPKSLNIGFQAAEGAYFTWTSDDNYYLPWALEKMHRYLEENKDLHMVCAQMDIIDMDNGKQFPYGAYADEEMYYQNCLGACFLYRRTVLEEVGEYDVNQFLVEDYDYWIRVLEKYGHIGFVKETCYKYRRHGSSLSRTRRDAVKKALSLLRINHLDWILNSGISKKLLVQIYYEMVAVKVITPNIAERFILLAQQLRNEKPLDQENEIIIYGAGEYGDLAYRKCGNKAVYYVDGNPQKAGKKKNGLTILSTDQLADRKGDYQILIAVGEDKILDIVNALKKIGIETWSIYQRLG